MSDHHHVDDATRKRISTLIARAALLGVAMTVLSDGRVLASRWNLHRELPDIAHAEQWLDRVGVKAGGQ